MTQHSYTYITHDTAQLCLLSQKCLSGWQGHTRPSSRRTRRPSPTGTDAGSQSSPLGGPVVRGSVGVVGVVRGDPPALQGSVSVSHNFTLTSHQLHTNFTPTSHQLHETSQPLHLRVNTSQCRQAALGPSVYRWVRGYAACMCTGAPRLD